MTSTAFLGIVAVAIAVCLGGDASAATPQAGASGGALAPGATEVMKWKDGKTAPFYMAFDDSCISQVVNVVPELSRRKMVGTFYINPDGGHFKSRSRDWEEKFPAMGMEYGNHTASHVGALSVASFEADLVRCGQEIDRCFPSRPRPRLVSFGQPGVPKDKWCITDAERDAVLTKLNLIQRPSFWGYPMHVKTPAELAGLVDKAITSGELAHIDFHGVGGDWLVTPMDDFKVLLDKLDSCRDQVWITDPISWHKYRTERIAADVKTVQVAPDRIRIALACRSDASLDGQKFVAYSPALYDMPLTLRTGVPATWKKVTVEQGKAKTTVDAALGAVRYDAIPGAGEIVIRKAM